MNWKALKQLHELFTIGETSNAILKNPLVQRWYEMELIEDVNKKYGNTVILVTHNDAIKNMADRVIKLRDGQIRHDIVNMEKTPAQELDW